MEIVTVEELLKKDLKGKVVVFPTDTVYGIGALYNDLEGIEKIYKIKKRNQNKPLAILTSTRNIDSYVNAISKDAKDLMNEKWPGALTLIFEKSDKVSNKLTMGFKTIAFRMPNSKIALAILEHFGLMATTSVNISGEAPMNNIDEICEKFKDDVDYIVKDRASFSTIPSTIIDVSGNEIKVIRK